MGLFGDDDTARRRDAVESTAPTPAGEVTPDGDGEVVAVEGVVRVHEETLEMPLADAEMVGMPEDGGHDDARDSDDESDRPMPSGEDAGGRSDHTDGTADSRASSGNEDAAEDGDPGADGSPRPDGGRERPTDDGTTRAADRAADERGPAVVTTYRRRPRGSTAPAEPRVEAVPFVVEDDGGRVLVDHADSDRTGQSAAVVDDAGGRVLVDATDAPAEAVLVSPGHTQRLLGDESGTRLVRASDTGLDATREIARARTALGTTPDWEHERGALRAGDRVYVLGSPRANGEADPATVIAADADAPFAVSDLSRSALAEQLDRQAGGLDRRFWLFAVVGGIAAIILLITVAVFLDSFVLTAGG